MWVVKQKTVPIYKSVLGLIFYDDPQKLIDKFNHIEFTHDPHGFQGGSFYLDGIVYIALWCDKKLSVGHVVHECKHAVNHIFKEIGQELDLNNDESECYLLQWVFEQTNRELKNSGIQLQ